MIAALISYAYAIGILGLMSEVESTSLIVLGWVMAIWMAVVGSLSGWAAARR